MTCLVFHQIVTWKSNMTSPPHSSQTDTGSVKCSGRHPKPLRVANILLLHACTLFYFLPFSKKLQEQVMLHVENRVIKGHSLPVWIWCANAFFLRALHYNFVCFCIRWHKLKDFGWPIGLDLFNISHDDFNYSIVLLISLWIVRFNISLTPSKFGRKRKRGNMLW